MQTQLTTLRSLATLSQQIQTAEMVKETLVKKKKTLLRITIIKVKLFFWNLSPLHWYDGFKTIQIDLNEFAPKNK